MQTATSHPRYTCDTHPRADHTLPEHATHSWEIWAPSVRLHHRATALPRRREHQQETPTVHTVGPWSTALALARLARPVSGATAWAASAASVVSTTGGLSAAHGARAVGFGGHGAMGSERPRPRSADGDASVPLPPLLGRSSTRSLYAVPYILPAAAARRRADVRAGSDCR